MQVITATLMTYYEPHALTAITTHINHTSNKGSTINKLATGTTRQMEIKIIEQRKQNKIFIKGN